MIINFVFIKFYQLGLNLGVLQALFNLVKKKADNLYMWKGVKWTRLKGVTAPHLKVITLFFCAQVQIQALL